MSAEDFKAQGNAAAKAGNFEEAVRCYTSAIELDGTNHVYYSNRSNVYSQLHRYEEALADAEQCIQLKPDFGKGYVRKCDALKGMGRLDDAMKAIDDGEAAVGDAEPLLAQRRSSLAEEQAAPFMRDLFGPGMEQKLRANPKTRAYLDEDPTLLARLRLLGTNPQMMMQMGADPKIGECMMVLLGIDPANLPTEMPGDASAATAEPTVFPEVKAEPEPEPVPEKTPEELDAERLKEEGNALFKEKQYEQAIAKYEAAFETFKAIVYLNNISSCLLKLGRVDEAEAKAYEAYDYSLEHSGSGTFEDRAKSLAKAASAQYQKKEYAKAIETLKRSMTEFRSRQTLALLRKVEEEYEAFQKEQAFDKDLAERLKEEGNTLFKAQKYGEAIEKYTEALKHLPFDDRECVETNARYVDCRTLLIGIHNNRSFAYFKIGQLNLSYDDATRVLELYKDSHNIKALLRKAQVERLRRQYYKAIDTYKIVLGLDPRNQDAIDGYGKAYLKVQEVQADPDSKESQEVINIALADEDIQRMVKDPGLAEVLKAISEDPKAAEAYLKDPTISDRINTLVNAGIIRTGRR